MSLALGVYRELLLYEEGGTHLYTAEEFPSPILRPHTPVKGLGMRLGSGNETRVSSHKPTETTDYIPVVSLTCCLLKHLKPGLISLVKIASSKLLWFKGKKNSHASLAPSDH